MAKGLTDAELKVLVDSELRQSLAYYGGLLSEQRRKAEYYYLGEAKGDLAPPEVEGRSRIVSTKVRDTVESMVPVIVAKFCSGDNVVEFEPTKDGDEEKAQSATDYINYLFFKRNKGFTITETWIRDALLQKKGILKVYWDTRHEETREEYKALDDVELAQILDDEEVEPIEHTQYPDEDDQEQRQQTIQHLTEQLQQAMQSAQQGDQRAMMDAQQMHAQIEQINSQPPKMLHDIAVKRCKTDGKLTIENVPPEEFMISRKAKTIQDAPFVAHRVMRTLSELRSMGYKNVDQLGSDDAAASLNAERIERLSWDDEQAYLNTETTSLDESQRTVWVVEAYIRCDRDGDGIAELVKVTKAGDTILDEEVVDVAPFVDIDCLKLPHKFFGLSIADLAMQSQLADTNLLRSGFDNLYFATNQRMYAVEGQVNLDDLLTSRPGGVVRVKSPQATGPLMQATGDGGALAQMMEHIQEMCENSTGWTRYSQGNDADSLNKTATGVQIVTNRADMRIDLIARNFAEGFTELFRMMLKLVLQNQDKEAVVRLNGNYVHIDPREWRNGFDININVGLGTGDKTQQAQHLMSLMQIQREAIQIGVATPEGIYEAAKEFAKCLGFKNGDKFFADPAKQPPKPPQPDPKIQIAQMQQQGDIQKFQAQIKMDKEAAQTQAQLEAAKTQMEQAQQQHLNELEAQRKSQELQQQAQLEMIKAQHAAELENARLDMDWRKAQLDAETQIIVANMGATKAQESAPAGESSTGNDQVLAVAMQGFQAALERLSQPRQVVRGPDGRVSGVV